MAPQKQRKGNGVTPAAVSSDDDNDDPDPSADPKGQKVATKKLERDKENEPENNQDSATSKPKVIERKKHVPWSVDRREVMNNYNYNSRHIIHYLTNVTQGTRPPLWQDQALNRPVMKTNKHLRIYRRYVGFDRRTTAVAWHPTHPNIVGVGSKGGDIIVWNYEVDGTSPKITVRGQGPGGSIQSLQFDESKSGCKAYTVSIDGTLALHDFIAGDRKNLLETGNWDHWYTSMDVSPPGGVIIVGDNKGYVTLLTIDGEQLWKEKLHKQKVTHIEFCQRMPWCLVSTSVDRSLKVWDIRNMKTKTSCLYSLMHKRPVNSAYFSRTDGGSLLTTDQESEIRIYKCPSFRLSKVIPHPHRQFQHLTPIKATWHPLRDIIVVGRYPDLVFPGYVTNEPRTIDFFNGVTGELMYQHQDKGYSDKIVSLNMFNHTGDRLLSAAGMFVWVWKPRFDKPKEYCCKNCSKKDLDSDDDYISSEIAPVCGQNAEGPEKKIKVAVANAENRRP